MSAPLETCFSYFCHRPSWPASRWTGFPTLARVRPCPVETAIANLNSGESGALAFGSAPSVAQFIVARACVAIRKRFPDLYIDLNVLKIEETVDYLLLERGEFVAMSYAFAHPSLEFAELGTGELVAAAGSPFRARWRPRPRRP
jgi:hypothetical protein